jgi:hypothetical protein
LIAVLPESSATKVGAPGTVRVTPPPDEPVSLLPPPPQPAKAPMLIKTKQDRTNGDSLIGGIENPEILTLDVLITGAT